MFECRKTGVVEPQQQSVTPTRINQLKTSVDGGSVSPRSGVMAPPSQDAAERERQRQREQDRRRREAVSRTYRF